MSVRVKPSPQAIRDGFVDCKIVMDDPDMGQLGLRLQRFRRTGDANFHLGNGLDTLKSYDAEGHPALITTGFGTGSAVQHQGFAYDVHGNLKSREDFNQTPPSGTGNTAIEQSGLLGSVLNPATITPAFPVQGVALGVPQIVSNVRDAEDE